MRHVVNFSGGAGSFAAASRVVDRFGAESVTLLAADTRSEAEDWYEFMDAAAVHLGAELVMLADGRDIWELATDKRAIPSAHKGFCSQILGLIGLFPQGHRAVRVCFASVPTSRTQQC